VVGGMLLATFIAPIFVPLFFALLARKPRPGHGEHHPLVQHADHDPRVDPAALGPENHAGTDADLKSGASPASEARGATPRDR